MPEKIKALLVDDEKASREVMSRLLRDYFPQVEVVGEAGNAEKAYAEIIEKNPDLVFLDIQMPKANGFSLLKKFGVIPFEVIFVTSFDEYAINAIKFSALDYLLKPVEIEDLKFAVAKACETIGKKANSDRQIFNLLHNLDTDSHDHKIAVHAGGKVKFLSEQHIVMIEADGRYSKVLMADSKEYVTAKYLRDFEVYFGEDSAFVRIGKSCLINVKYIKSYSKGEPCIIEMENGNTFEVARRKKGEVLERLRKGWI